MTHPDMTSPVDLPPPDEDEQHPLIWASTVIAVATGFLLLFNAGAIRGWAFDLEPGPQNERVVAIVDGWYKQTEAFYLDRPVAAMSGWWEGVKALEFGSEDEAVPTEGVADPAAADESETRSSENDSEGPGFSPQ